MSTPWQGTPDVGSALGGPVSGTTAVVAVTPTPSPGPTVRTPDPDRVTPGTAGFLVMFLLALATVLLVRSMTRHLRRVRFSAEATGPAAGAAEPEQRSGPAQP